MLLLGKPRLSPLKPRMPSRIAPASNDTRTMVAANPERFSRSIILVAVLMLTCLPPLDQPLLTPLIPRDKSERSIEVTLPALSAALSS
jgi:hypothetical protein